MNRYKYYNQYLYMLKEECMEQGVAIAWPIQKCRECNCEFVVESQNKCTRESFRCEKCNKKNTWYNLIYNMFF